MNEILNMGFYDITNSMPLDIKSYGKEHKNKEIQAATNYIKKNLDIFRNSILVCDRGYHSYEFCKFLDDNNIKFIIRFKGNAENLQPSKKLVKSIPNYETIMHLRNKVKTVVYNNTITKTMHSSISKKSISEKTIKIKNNCVLVTNILDKTAFNDERILEIYKTRWDIEVFFKYIKNNFKFQNLTQSSKQHYKMYLCMLIITYISLIVEKYYYSRMKSVKVKKNVTYKVNKSELVNGVFDKLLYDILMNRITIEILNNFCNIYIKIIQNKNNRTYPRTSKTPFTKWYIKGYSKLTQYNKVIDAIINGNIETLNKNLKLIAESIIAINGKKYG